MKKPTKAHVERYKQVVAHFGPAQDEAATKLAVSQPTVSYWVTGVNGMSGAVAKRVELKSGGKFKAIDLVVD